MSAVKEYKTGYNSFKGWSPHQLPSQSLTRFPNPTSNRTWLTNLPHLVESSQFSNPQAHKNIFQFTKRSVNSSPTLLHKKSYCNQPHQSVIDTSKNSEKGDKVLLMRVSLPLLDRYTTSSVLLSISPSHLLTLLPHPSALQVHPNAGITSKIAEQP